MPAHYPARSSLRTVATAAAILGLTTLFTPARADFWHILDLGTLDSGASQGFFINASGQVVGNSLFGITGNNHAFRTAPGGLISDPGADLGTLGGSQSFAYGINAAGQVTGDSDLTGNATFHAFRTTAAGSLSDATATDLGTLGGTASSGYAINASGQVTGLSDTTGDLTGHAFRTSATGLISDPGTDLGAFAGDISYGYGINDSGQVTGLSLLSNSAAHAFRTTAIGLITDPGTDIGTLGGDISAGYAINASGQVAGVSFLTGNFFQHAFRTTAGGLVSDPGTDLGTLGGDNSFASGLNNAGDVVGDSEDSFGDVRAFLYTDAFGMQDLNALLAPTDQALWFLEEATSLNDNGQITGFGIIDGQEHAFLLSRDATDTPEPGTVALFTSLGLVGATLVRRPKRRASLLPPRTGPTGPNTGI